MATTQPLYVGTANAATAAGGASSLALPYVSHAGGFLLLGVALNDGTQTVSAITDSAGNDAQGNPINKWVLIAVQNFASTRLEFWVCIPTGTITTLTINFTGSQKVVAMIGEWSGVTNYNFTLSGSVSSGQNPVITNHIQLYLPILPPTQDCLLVGFFSVLTDTFTTAAFGTLRSKTSGSSPIPVIAMVEQGTVGADSNDTVGMFLTSLATGGNIAASSLQGIALMLSGGFHLSSPPGFADLPDAVLVAGKLALGTEVSKISENAAFGMVNVEFFSGDYHDGDTVALPVSPVDGYVYQRSELNYMWGIKSTANPTTGWLTGPDTLWYMYYDVDQTTGKVTVNEWYRRSGSHANPAKTSDGTLNVVTVAQRLKGALTMSEVPVYTSHPTTDFYQDRPANTTLMNDLNDNAKFGVISTEAIYMGEFKNGDVIPQPVSPVDGYVYPRGTAFFQSSWRWTPEGDIAFGAPPMSEGQFARFDMTTVDYKTGAVNIAIWMVLDGQDNATRISNYGRISVVALCSRKNTIGLASAADAGGVGGMYNGMVFGKVIGTDLTSPITTPWTFSSKIPKIADGGNRLNITRATLAKTAIGSNVVLQSWPITWNGGSAGITQAATTSDQIVTCDPISVVLDQTHDWHIRVYFDGSTPASQINTSSSSPSSGAYLRVAYGGNADTTAAGTIDAAAMSNYARYFAAQGVFDSVTFIGMLASLGQPKGTFTEIDPATFYPGATFRASILKQIAINAYDAAMMPEFFGPFPCSNGTVIPLVTSADGYVYSRNEMMYVFEWTMNGANSGGHTRTPLMFAFVDTNTGRATVGTWRLPPGGPYVENDDGTISVMVIAIRGRQAPEITGVGSNSPSDAGTIVTDATEGFYVNGS